MDVVYEITNYESFELGKNNILQSSSYGEYKEVMIKTNILYKTGLKTQFFVDFIAFFSIYFFKFFGIINRGFNSF